MYQLTGNILLSAYVKTKDTRLFDEIYKQYYKKILNSVRKIVTNSEQAEDLAMETIQTLLQKDFKNVDNIEAFLFTTARNKCLNYVLHYKSLVKVHEYLLEKKLIEGESIKVDLDQENAPIIASIIAEAVDKIPGRAAETIILMYLYKMSYIQVAMRMKIGVETVKDYRKVAIDKLRILIKDKIEQINQGL